MPRWLVMAALVVAGESIFVLPFVVARVFRPTLLDVFGLTNLELGTAFSVYGVVAMVAYLTGGPLADLFPARRLMAMALVTTALGGVVYASVPSLGVLTLLFGFWGATTILLFWAALIRATREWGGHHGQGRAFGLLDGGRGLVAALLASATVGIFALLLPADVATATLAQRTAALQQIVWLCTGLTAAVAGLVWLAVPEGAAAEEAPSRERLRVGDLLRVARLPAVWLQAVVVVCAYVAYKSTDDFSLYARDAFGYDDVAAAKVGSVSFWVRPVAAIAAGLVGDRVGPSRAIVLCFGALVVTSSMLGLGIVRPGADLLLLVMIAATSAAIYALRGIYFALFGEARVPLAHTGSAVGLVSVVGYTPDVFMGPLMGWLLDRSPGATGHHHLFLVITGFAAVGFLATLAFRRVTAVADRAAVVVAESAG